MTLLNYRISDFRDQKRPSCIKSRSLKLYGLYLRCLLAVFLHQSVRMWPNSQKFFHTSRRAENRPWRVNYFYMSEMQTSFTEGHGRVCATLPRFLPSWKSSAVCQNHKANTHTTCSSRNIRWAQNVCCDTACGLLRKRRSRDADGLSIWEYWA